VLGTYVTHPNILPFYGAFISDEQVPRICIVTPWMEGGNLVDHLDKNPDVARAPLVNVVHFNPFQHLYDDNLPQVFDILSGLQHLHELEIVHADLKGVRFYCIGLSIYGLNVIT
jgi:serine/threonine protein kinase